MYNNIKNYNKVRKRILQCLKILCNTRTLIRVIKYDC